VTAALVALGASGAKAQSESSAPPAAPCARDSLYRRFDFWIGSWLVTTPGGTPVGTSRVDVVSGGCAILESWRSVRGAEGKSLNTYDAARGQWRQFWVGQAGGLTDYSRSEWDGKALVFYADVAASNGKAASVYRLSFTPLDSDVVRQFGEVSKDGGRSWQTTYDFRYHRSP
jgi:hypothetical protein